MDKRKRQGSRTRRIERRWSVWRMSGRGEQRKPKQWRETGNNTVWDEVGLEPSLCKVVLTRLRNKKRPPPLTIVDHKEPGEESSFEQVDHYHLDRQLLLGLGDLRLASLPSPPVVVHEKGFLSMALSHGVPVDLTPRQALRVSNPVQASSIAISSCGRQLAFLHPTGWHFPKQRCQFFLTQMFRENAAVWTQVWTHNRTTGMGQRFTSNRNQILFNR